MSNIPRPPIAPRAPHAITLHGESWSDDYFWLRERDNPEVLAYLEAENAYAEQALAGTAELRATLFDEMRGRIKEDDSSAPLRIDEFFYYSRTEAGRQYPIFCRKRGSLDAPEELLLDQNTLAGDEPFCEIGAYAVSPNHQLLAFSVDLAGDESYTLYVKDLTTGELLPEQIPATYYGLEWAEDNRTLFYTTIDAARRPYRLWRHTLGADPLEDALVYEERDEAFFLGIQKTRSRAYLLLRLASTSTSELRFCPAADPQAPFVPVEPRRAGHEYDVEHHGERFLIVSNDGALNFRLLAAPTSSPGRASWQELIPHSDDVLLDGVDAFRDFLVLSERRAGLPRLRVVRPDGTALGEVQVPDAAYTLGLDSNPMFDSQRFRFVYSSLVTPTMVADYDPTSARWEVVKQSEIPSGYDPAQYTSERLHARAPDGALVPISLVYKRGWREGEARRLLLGGYGAYGVCYDPSFSALRLSLLDRGFGFAIAHVRGGSELGRAWYEAGKLLQKQHSFDDLIAAAEHLIGEGYTSAEGLAISGGSAGGLLVGAAMTQRPDLFKAVVAEVPFVDVINTMLDTSLPLVVNEWEQWGNPADETFYRYMKGYSPYDNVAERDYPHLLITAGLNDPRVCYWEPAKWAAKLRAHKTDGNLLLLKTNLSAGHGGASGRYDHLKEIAFIYAFLLAVV